MSRMHVELIDIKVNLRKYTIWGYKSIFESHAARRFRLGVARNWRQECISPYFTMITNDARKDIDNELA